MKSTKKNGRYEGQIYLKKQNQPCISIWWVVNAVGMGT